MVAVPITVISNMSAVPAYPSLNDSNWITNPSDIINEILQFYICAPKTMSDIFFRESISLNDTLSKSKGTIPQVCNAITRDLLKVLIRYFGNDSSTVVVTPTTTDGVNYVLTLTISVSYNGNTYTANNRLSVNNNTNDVTIMSNK